MGNHGRGKTSRGSRGKEQNKEAPREVPAQDDVVPQAETPQGLERILPTDALPPLPDILAGSSNAGSSLERQVARSYQMAHKKSISGELSALDLVGPQGLISELLKIRQRVYESHQSAERKLKVATALCGQIGGKLRADRLAKRTDDMIRAQQEVWAAKRAGVAFNLVKQLWDQSPANGLMEEWRDELDSIGARELMHFRHLNSSNPALEPDVGCEGDDRGGASASKPPGPRFTGTELLPSDALADVDVQGQDDLHPTEDTPDEVLLVWTEFHCLLARCKHCQLRLVDLLDFISQMAEARNLVCNLMTPGLRRLRAARIYNVVLTALQTSTAYQELEAYRQILFPEQDADDAAHCGNSTAPRALEDKVSKEEEDASHSGSSGSGETVCSADTAGDSQGDGSKDCLIDAHNTSSTSSSSSCEELQLIAGGDRERRCIACLEKHAVFVIARCGHLVFCRACRRRAVYRVLQQNTSAPATSSWRRDLRARELDRTSLGCPICREEGVAVLEEKFEGRVIVP